MILHTPTQEISRCNKKKLKTKNEPMTGISVPPPAPPAQFCLPLCRLHGRQAEQSHCSGPTKAGLPCVGGILVIGKGLQSRELWRSILWAEHGHCPQTVIEDMITRRFFLPRKWGGVFYEATLLLEDLYTVNRLLGSKRDFLQQVSSIIFSCFS